MGSDDETDRPAAGAAVVQFPHSRVVPVQSADPDAPVRYGAMAERLGIPREQTTGHWCSRCRAIWYGYLLEVACPTCGNRHG